jgi:hypothetical protein
MTVIRSQAGALVAEFFALVLSATKLLVGQSQPGYTRIPQAATA